MQQAGDCGFFNWADNEMSSYEMRMVHRLKDDEQQSRAEVRRLEQRLDIMLQRLKDVEHQSRTEIRRLEQKLDTEVEKKMCQFKEKMCQAVVYLIILLVLLYISSYHGSSSHKYMLKWTTPTYYHVFKLETCNWFLLCHWRFDFRRTFAFESFW